ncbi:STAS domain-containing protein [Methylomarinum vadi]|uniref:STAS domain-containing protein n=1 Tax=Methylomarinum vadi TaxID=438855 RepID=UPI000567AC72|nr:STAS domain-containing protein [Methylomarinum vadi]
MAEKQDPGLIGYDPLAWIDDEDDSEDDAEKLADTAMPDSAPAAQTKARETEPVAIASSEDQAIVLEPVLTIQHVGELYQKLQAVLESQDKIELDASEVTSIDTAVLQLLIALKKTAVGSGKDVTIDFPSEKFIEAADLLGVSEMLEVEQAAAGFF